jgi:hypothetical protein
MADLNECRVIVEPLAWNIARSIAQFHREELGTGTKPQLDVEATMYFFGSEYHGTVGALPAIFAMSNQGTIEVLNLVDSSPLNSLDELKSAPSNWYVSPAHARTIEACLLNEEDLRRQWKAQDDNKQRAGRYTLKEAAQTLSDNANVRNPDMLQKLRMAVESGKLPVYWPGGDDRYLYGPKFATKIRDYYEEARWDELNKWLDSNELGVRFRFSVANTTNTDGTAAAIARPQSRLGSQEQMILATISELGYAPKALPRPVPGKPGVKADVRKKATSDHKDLFQGKTIFNKTWERLRRQGEITDAE